MLINKQETIVTFTKESSSFKEFLANFFQAYENHKEYHIIINLFSIDKLTAKIFRINYRCYQYRRTSG